MEEKGSYQLNHVHFKNEAALMIQYSGDINVYHLKKIWSESLALIRRYCPKKISIDLDALKSYDNAFVHLLSKLNTLQKGSQNALVFKSDQYPIISLFNLYNNVEDVAPEKIVKKRPLLETIGRTTFSTYQSVSNSITFLGQLILKSVYLKSFLTVLVKELCEAGPKALFIIALMGLILGIILSLQGAFVLAVFGAQVYIVKMVVITLTRELAPLMTAFIVTGRSVAAFGAEIGAMSVNQEIDALETMRIDKIPFIIIPKVFSIICTIPLLNLYMLFFGFLGCGIVFIGLGYSVEFYYAQLSQAFALKDLWGGLFKVIVFGAIIASIGCNYGLQARHGPSSVGVATTKSVVMSIVMIIIADGIFSVLFYKLGI